MLKESLGNVLVVDDEAVNRSALSRRLQNEGYTVSTASGGAEVARLISKEPFDAVLLDVMMPGLNGYQVLAEIRKSYTRLELPVVMVTSKNKKEDIVRALTAGANDYITKPINFRTAISQIGRHIATKRLTKEVRQDETKFASEDSGIKTAWTWDLLIDRITCSSIWRQTAADDRYSMSEPAEEWFHRIHPDDRPQAWKAIEDHRQGLSTRCYCEYRIRLENESFEWAVLTCEIVSEDSGYQVQMVGSQTFRSRRRSTDPLTGLANRTVFVEYLDHAVSRARAQPDYLFVVLSLNIDQFKVGNNPVGYQVWDEALVEMARRLKSCMHDSDIISRPVGGSSIRRFGGDEFIVLVHGIKQLDNATHIGNRILNVVSKPIQLDDKSIPVVASVGLAIGSRDSGAAEELLSNAASAMSQAKTKGESCLCLFDKTVRSQASQRLTLEADMSQGLRHRQFEVHYQPIVSLKSGMIEGFEALLRWHHPTQGLISAAQFITIAENLGKIVELGSGAMKEACQQLHTWQSFHPDLAHAYISVNISANQFFDPGFSKVVTRCLEDTGLAAHNLKLEIPESIFARDPDACTTILHMLYKLGVRFSLDDFGGGHSSLSYVQQFPIDTIKIDRSLIAQMKDSVQSQEVVKGIVEIAHGFGMSVTAKGVENQSQVAMLRDFGCETGQGLLYASPVPHSAIET